MMRLHSDWSYLEQAFDCSIRDHFLMAVRSLDNPRAVTPFLLESTGRQFGLFLHVEKGNVEAARLPPEIEPRYYQPYFTFDETEGASEASKSLSEAVEALAEGQRDLTVDRRLPLSIVKGLSDAFSVVVEGGAGTGPVSARRIPCAQIMTRLGSARARITPFALRLLEESPVRDRISPFLEMHDIDSFERLDQMLSDAGIDALLVSSRLNVQEISGVPVRCKRRPLAALYVTGADNAWILEGGHSVDSQAYPSAAAALAALAPSGKLGVETEDVDAGLAEDFDLYSRGFQAADTLLRRWRDGNTLPDLSFYLIATRISRKAIEGALAFAEKAITGRRAHTEMDAYAIYLDLLRNGVRESECDLRVGRTLTNFHSGSRTSFPANPASHPLDGGTNTLKIDAGCLIFDGQGYLLGCSDIARTLCLSADGRDLYDAFKAAVRGTLIPAVRSGATGEELHRAGVEAIWGNGALTENALFVQMQDPVNAYDRDVGHLLGKNNLAHLRFANGDKGTLRQGMIACCEYQWPIAGHAIAYEDTCLVTDDGGLNLTSDEE